MYEVVRYFDDHLDGIVSVHETEEQANIACNNIRPGTYLSYGVRQSPNKPEGAVVNNAQQPLTENKASGS